MNKNVSLVLLVAVVLVFLWAISGSRAPKVPRDKVHAALLDNASCAPCHATGMKSPLKPAHPPKEQCLICHKK